MLVVTCSQLRYQFNQLPFILTAGQEEEEEEEEELPCQDDNASCGVWFKAGECARNPSFMNDNCRKSCGRC